MDTSRLDETLTAKVADFGLTRDVYISEYYVMNRSIPLPVKWLAPEALFDQVFSEKTDVVSVSDTIWLIFVCIHMYIMYTCQLAKHYYAIIMRKIICEILRFLRLQLILTKTHWV